MLQALGYEQFDASGAAELGWMISICALQALTTSANKAIKLNCAKFVFFIIFTLLKDSPIVY